MRDLVLIQGTKNAMRIVFKNRRYAAGFAVLLVLTFAIYLYLFTSAATGFLYFGGSYIYFVVLLSAAISILLSMILILNIYAVKNQAAANKSASLFSILMSVLPGSLCCTTILPSLFAVAGASAPFLINGGVGSVQGLLSTLEIPLILISIALLLFGLHIASKNVISCCRAR